LLCETDVNAMKWLGEYLDIQQVTTFWYQVANICHRNRKKKEIFWEREKKE